MSHNVSKTSNRKGKRKFCKSRIDMNLILIYFVHNAMWKYASRQHYNNKRNRVQ